MKRILEYIGLVLITLTLFAYLLGYLKIINTSLVVVLLLTTFIKGVLISDYFMGLHYVEMRYRIIPLLWLTIVITLIGIGYYLPVS